MGESFLIEQILFSSRNTNINEKIITKENLFLLTQSNKTKWQIHKTKPKNGSISRLELTWSSTIDVIQTNRRISFSFDLCCTLLRWIMSNISDENSCLEKWERRIYWERSVCMMWWSIVIHIKKKKEERKKPIDDQSLSFVCLCSEWFDLDHDDINVTKWETMIHRARHLNQKIKDRSYSTLKIETKKKEKEKKKSFSTYV